MKQCYRLPYTGKRVPCTLACRAFGQCTWCCCRFAVDEVTRFCARWETVWNWAVCCRHNSAQSTEPNSFSCIEGQSSIDLFIHWFM